MQHPTRDANCLDNILFPVSFIPLAPPAHVHACGLADKGSFTHPLHDNPRILHQRDTSERFLRDLRTYGYISVLLLSATVLGLAAYLGSIFLPNLNRDFSIFSLVVPSLTILIFLTMCVLSNCVQLSGGQLKFDLRLKNIMVATARRWVLPLRAWGALALYGSMGHVCYFLTAKDEVLTVCSDILGNEQCDTLGGQRTTTKNGSISSKSYCYEMRVMQAFSWMLFSLLTIFLIIVISRTTAAQALGRRYAWSEPIVELPWFGQYPGWPEDEAGPYGSRYAYPAGAPMPGYASSQPMQVAGGGYVIQQNPGHSVVIQPGSNGQAPTITQIPGMVSSA
ncbi:hypothetical protein EUX98_g604 [Antrodiella citrinella]|uniref:Uncharacterized protein n=1 Tax=Antrodiella citrinella TaxID=2447956 RepID=A0A4S4NC89_9APHY|nr:hypothetical protein EUX98_g604 [Antrodiella citrinella]